MSADLVPIQVDETTDMAALLRSLMDDSGITGAELATKVGRSRNLVSMWRVGKRAPSPASLARIAHVFGYDLALIPKDTP